MNTNFATVYSELLNSMNQYRDILELGLIVAITLYWIGIFIVMYHLIRFGVGTLPKRIAVLFMTGCIILTVTTILFFTEIFMKGAAL